MRRWPQWTLESLKAVAASSVSMDSSRAIYADLCFWIQTYIHCVFVVSGHVNATSLASGNKDLFKDALQRIADGFKDRIGVGVFSSLFEGPSPPTFSEVLYCLIILLKWRTILFHTIVIQFSTWVWALNVLCLVQNDSCNLCVQVCERLLRDAALQVLRALWTGVSLKNSKCFRLLAHTTTS